MDVLAGIRVLEVSHYAYVPSAAAVLADWGADVIKVEHATSGDPMRGVTIGNVAPQTNGFTFMWESVNRGKRSIGIDLTHPDGRDLLTKLMARADVFLTSFLPPARMSLGIDEGSVRLINDRIIYAAGTGHGRHGASSMEGGYDLTSFWYRGGIAERLAGDAPHPPPLPSAGFGDVLSGLALAGGVAAALLKRERSGTPTTVDGSLLATALWAGQGNIASHSITGQEFTFGDRFDVTNPLVNSYRTSDGRFVGLCILQAQRHWHAFCNAIGAPALADRPEFATAEARMANARRCVDTLDAIFGAKPLAHWVDALKRQTGPWCVVHRSGELADDDQVEANRYVQSVDYGNSRSIDLVASPIQFDGASPTLQPAPEHGSSTEEVLLEYGLDWDEIIRLKERGAIN